MYTNYHKHIKVVLVFVQTTGAY